MSASAQSGGFQVASYSAVAQGSEAQQQQLPAAATAVSEASQSSRQETTTFQRSRAQQLSCLYTKHKTQKRKIWNDGRLVLSSARASLYDAHPPPGSGDPKLDECELNRSQYDALLRQIENRIVTEKFLVEVTGSWTVSTVPMAMIKPNQLVSQSMQKVVTRKFRKPGAFIPRNPIQERQSQVPAKRARPLQPGELQQRFYGHAAGQPPPPEQRPPSWNQAPQNMHGNQPNGTRTVRFQQGHGEQQPAQNQMGPRYENPNPQPPFQTRPAQSTDANRQQVPPSAPLHAANRHPTNNMPPSALPQSFPPLQGTPQIFEQRGVRSNVANTGQNAFVMNGFDPNNFYGEDEELSQEDDNEADNLGWSLQSPTVRRNKSPKQHPILENRNQNGNSRNGAEEKAAEPIQPPNDPSESSPDEPAGGLPSRNETGGRSEALSTNQLLMLFGAAPPAAPVLADNTDESNLAAAQISEDPTQFEFVLPPASDSSSDEDDSDNPGEE
jgi:hypothetical protein